LIIIRNVKQIPYLGRFSEAPRKQPFRNGPSKIDDLVKSPEMRQGADLFSR
jgi:hypothetical protein